MSKATGQSRTLADRLKAWRELRGWSVNRAAQAAGVNHASWLHWEAGRHMPTHRSLEKIAAAFGCSLANLLGGDK